MSKVYKPNVTGSSGLYTFFWYWFSPFFWAFWRRRQFIGTSNIPKNKPTFLLANHSNALLDALSSTPVKETFQLTFLMRASPFKNKTLAKLFYKLNILPIYRHLDGVEQLEKNNDVFLNCVWIFERNRRILCFPEGSHSLVKRLRPFKKGPLRFAFGAEEKNNFELDMHMVPVGMMYMDQHTFGGDLLIIYGEPIRLSKYTELYKSNQARALNELKRDTENGLREIMIHISNEEYYAEIELCREVAISELREGSGRKSTLHEEFLEGKRAVTHLENTVFNKPEAAGWKEKIAIYKTALERNNLREFVLSDAYKPMNTALAVSVFLVLLPFYLTGAIINALPFFTAVPLAKKLVKDEAFMSSIIWAVSMFSFSFYYPLAYLTIGIITGYWLYALAIWPVGLITGAIALFVQRKLNRFMAEQRLKKFMATPEGKDAKAIRNEILGILK